MQKADEEMQEYLTKWWNELTVEQKRIIWLNTPVSFYTSKLGEKCD